MSTHSQTIGKLAEALAKAQGEIVGAVKDSKNPFFKSNYADLASVWDACRGPLSKFGLSVIQTTDETVESGIVVITTLAHSSGEWTQGRLPIKALKLDPQGIGSAITYARRYALAAIVGVAQIDDDGEAAMARPRVVPESPAPNDGHDDGKALPYRIPFGKFMKRGLEEVDLDELRSYIVYLEKKAIAENKPLTGVVGDFIERATAYIVALEQGR